MEMNCGKLKKYAFRVTKNRNMASARIRVPGGYLNAKVLGQVQHIAETYGNGEIHLTIRQGFEIMGIPFEKVEEVKLGSYACTLFTLSAKIKDIEYPRVLLWVTTDDGLIRKKEEYSLSGQLLRTTAIPSYQRVMQGKTERHVPVSMLIVDNLRGKKIDNSMQYEKTQITIKNVSFQNQSDIVFTKNYLELMSK